jgi:hypothetical protein
MGEFQNGALKDLTARVGPVVFATKDLAPMLMQARTLVASDLE